LEEEYDKFFIDADTQKPLEHIKKLQMVESGQKVGRQVLVD
jgi:hypothetical protein